MKPPTTVSTANLVEEPYASLVCYPRANKNEMAERIIELQKLGIEAVEFTGRASAFSFQVLGKGYVGIVVIAYVGGQKFALKMQRVDSERISLEHESRLLQLANTVGVGPMFVAATKHFLLMQLIDGNLLQEWLENHNNPDQVRTVLTDILEQCWCLDEISLDHGELSKAPKHLLMNGMDKPFIVDFETASTTRNASNVTSVCQFLFQGNSGVCKKIAEVLNGKNRSELIALLRNYRRNRNRGNFEEILRLCLQ